MAIACIAGLWWWGLPRWRAHLETLGAWYVKAGPIAVQDAAGQPLLATIVVQERPNWERPTRRGYANDLIVELQLNHPDARDAGRAFVHRSEAHAVETAFLGADRDRVWVFAEGLHAIELSTRTVAIDPAGIEARVPALRGQLSSDVRHYAWRPGGGLTLRTRDGRRVDLDTTAWTLGPAPEPTPIPQSRTHDEWLAQVAAYDAQVAVAFGPRDATLPGEFGLDSWRAGDRWLGVLSDGQQSQYARAWAYPARASFGSPERRKIWLARTAALAERAPALGAIALTDVRAASSDAYLGGGVLRDGVAPRPVPVPDATDVVIEHYTAIDATGQVQLTRIGFDGTVRWTATLPLRFPRNVAAVGEHVALTGFAPGVDDDRRLGLVSVRLRDGAITTYAFNP